jgi:hypothetical protein
MKERSVIVHPPVKHEGRKVEVHGMLVGRTRGLRDVIEVLRRLASSRVQWVLPSGRLSIEAKRSASSLMRASSWWTVNDPLSGVGRPASAMPSNGPA